MGRMAYEALCSNEYKVRYARLNKELCCWAKRLIYLLVLIFRLWVKELKWASAWRLRSPCRLRSSELLHVSVWRFCCFTLAVHGPMCVRIFSPNPKLHRPEQKAWHPRPAAVRCSQLPPSLSVITALHRTKWTKQDLLLSVRVVVN